MERQSIELDGGRSATYWEFGDPDGRPTIALHGTPMSGGSFRAWHRLAAKAGIRLIAPNRAGIGGASLSGPFRVVDEAARLDAFATALGLRRYRVLGISGGAPYALGLAERTAAGVAALVVGAGLGELARWADPSSVSSSQARLLTDPIAADREMRQVFDLFRHDPDAAFSWATAGMDAAARHALAERAGSRAAFITDLMGEALEDGPDGVIADYHALGAPWDVDLTAIDVPTTIFHGDADTSVGLPHGRALADRLPNATLTIWPGATHFLGASELADLLEACS